jgi:hypothetical protein
MSNTTNVTVVNVYVLQPVYDSLNMGPIPPGTTPDAATASILAKLRTSVTTNWPAAWPAYDDTQVDAGIMQPWSGNVGGSAPQCVVDQITLDFNSWSFPNDGAMITQMAKEITEQVSASGGNTGVFDGKARRGAATTLYWRVSYTTGIAIDNPETLGVFYGFCAVLG